MTWQPPTPKQWHRVGLAAAVTVTLLLAGGLTASFVTESTAQQTEAELSEWSVDDVNRTLDGDLSDLDLTADVEYQYDVEDADRRLVKLAVGPTKNKTETITFEYDREPAPQGAGTVTLTESILSAESLDAEMFRPALAESNTTEIVVGAGLEIQRANGETVTSWAYDRVEIMLTDDATLTASVGGTGNVTVQTGQ